MSIRSLALCLLVLAPSLAFADGNKLLEECAQAERFIESKQGDNVYAIGRCLGMVQGVRNTLILLNSVIEPKFRTCWPPDGITNGQAIRIVAKYLRDHPATLHLDEEVLLMFAFRTAYACK